MKLTSALFATLAVAISATDAAAQDAQGAGETANILGAWAFDAYPTYPTCGLSGELIVRQGASEDDYECELVATDTCPDVWSYTAEQTCTARRNGDQLVIESTILNVEPATDRYLPDNFVLTIVNGSLMVGELISAVNAKAQFYRGVGPIS